MIAASVLALSLVACGTGEDIADETDSTSVLADAQARKTPHKKESPRPVEPAPVTGEDPATSPTSPEASWFDTALRDMRATDGRYSTNHDRLLHRSAVSYSSQTDRAGLVMGRYGTSDAFTPVNPDYATELSYLSASSPLRSIEVWPRLLIWDQLYLSERFGPNHASGYTGNTRVRTWGYELWVKSKAGVWRRLVQTDTKSAEAWRPTFRGSASFDSTALDYRKEPDGSTSVRNLPKLGFDGSNTYWVPHGYAGGKQLVDPYDIQDVLVLAYSQLILHDPSGIDDRQHARFLFAVGADWYPPTGTTGITYYPGVGTSRHKYVTAAPQLHVMHTMTEAEFRANPPPR